MDWAKEEERWVETIKRLRVSFVHDDIATVPFASFDELSDYSCTVPTGAVIGKIWKRGEPYQGSRTWWLGQYLKSDKPEYVDIKWRELWVIVDHPTAWGAHRATDELFAAIKEHDDAHKAMDVMAQEVVGADGNLLP